MIHSLVQHILACTDVLHILARNAHILHGVIVASQIDASQHQRKWLNFFSLRENGNFLKSKSEKRVKNFR